MARKVKCVLTGETGTSDTFYKADNGKYYKSKEMYDAHKQDSRFRIQAKSLILELMGWQEGEPFPALLNKKIKDFDFYPGETLYKTVQNCRQSITWAMENKEFSSSQGKVFYICAVISNNIGDTHREIKKQTQIQKRDEKIADVYISEEIKSKPRVKDLSAWLEEDDEL